METKAIPTASINILDESFDAAKSNTYHLSILANENEVAYSILDTNTNKYIALKSFTPSLNREIPSVDPLQELGASSFRSVSCAVAHHKFTLIPSALFDEENKESLMGFNHPTEKTEVIHFNNLRNLDAKNIFTIEKELESTIRKQFPNAKFMHHSTAFIEGLLIQHKNNSAKKVFADFNAGYFTVVLLNGRELLFSNAFTYKTPEDIAYYLLFVYEQLHLNPEEIELILSGEMEKTAKEHALLYNYIRHVKFAARPDGFQYSYKFEHIQSHRFFSLFNQYLATN